MTTKNTLPNDENDESITATSDLFIATLLSAPKNEPILRDMINGVLEDAGDTLIKTATVLNPFNIKEYVNDKCIILDVRVRDERDHIFNIEVQTAPHTAFIGSAKNIALVVLIEPARSLNSRVALRSTRSFRALFLSGAVRSGWCTVGRTRFRTNCMPDMNMNVSSRFTASLSRNSGFFVMSKGSILCSNFVNGADQVWF